MTILTAEVVLTNRANMENKNGTLLNTTLDVDGSYVSFYTQGKLSILIY